MQDHETLAIARPREAPDRSVRIVFLEVSERVRRLPSIGIAQMLVWG
jgi:hypothetical protein